MKFDNVYIESVAYNFPENIVTSEELEKRMEPLYERLKLPFGRLELISGIKERRFWSKGIFPSDIASEAGNRAIKKSGIDRDQIECLICASVCRDFLEPATASVIHNNLGLRQSSFIFDVSNACLGVLNGMMIIGNMIELEQISAGLIVSGENGGPLIDNTIEALVANPQTSRSDLKLAFASLTIGSAAAAVLLTHKNISKSGHKLLGGENRSATQHNDLCRGNADRGMDSKAEPLMQTNSETLMKMGVELARETWEITKSGMGWTNSDVDRVFTHQVGSMHRKLLYETLGLEIEKDFSTLEFLGNTGSAALPATLALGEEKGHVRKGDTVALLGIGSGLNCLMLGAEW